MKPNALQWLLLVYIYEFQGLNLSPETSNLDWFLWFSSVLPTKCQILLLKNSITNLFHTSTTSIFTINPTRFLYESCEFEGMLLNNARHHTIKHRFHGWLSNE